jgi:hypothetical protein
MRGIEPSLAATPTPSGAAEKPSWMQAMPDNPAAADLAPVVPPPIGHRYAMDNALH